MLHVFYGEFQFSINLKSIEMDEQMQNERQREVEIANEDSLVDDDGKPKRTGIHSVISFFLKILSW
jgi:hypothetical protein